jgi:putative redox protein
VLCVMTIDIDNREGFDQSAAIHVGAHELLSDVSRDRGGSDAAPSPHDLYDAALGACKALTLMWHCRRHVVPLTSIQVIVRRDASNEHAGIYRLETVVRVGGAALGQHLRELQAVAERCPVQKLMTVVETVISTRVELVT